MYIIRKPDYRLILSINLPEVFELLKIARLDDLEFNRYSWKQIYYQILDNRHNDLFIQVLYSGDMKLIRDVLETYDEYQTECYWAYKLSLKISK